MTLSFQPCNESATATDVECDCGWFGHFADVADARAESELHRCPADIATSSDAAPETRA